MDTHGDKKLRLTQILVNQKLILKFVNRKVKIVWEQVNPEHPCVFFRLKIYNFLLNLQENILVETQKGSRISEFLNIASYYLFN